MKRRNNNDDDGNNKDTYRSLYQFLTLVRVGCKSARTLNDRSVHEPPMWHARLQREISRAWKVESGVSGRQFFRFLAGYLLHACVVSQSVSLVSGQYLVCVLPSIRGLYVVS